ncbi:MAG: gas vesicle protein GvpD P-loop domain-containing protein, partial [Candidatus Helarchaeota archaeon]
MQYDHPVEIKKALSSPIGFTLLIKGQAGTGKTSLALGILINTINAIYLTSRLSPESILKQFPWLKDYGCADKIVDASNLGFTNQVTVEGFKKKLVFHNSPEFLLKIVEITEKMQHGTIIVDSWDAIIEKDLKDPKEILRQVEPFLMELVRQRNYNLVLIEENKSHDYLDYLADGVVILEDKRMKMLRIRTIEMKKIRGVKCSQPEYVFSLENGRFQYFPKFKLTFPSIMIKPPPIKDPNIDFVSTGIKNLDLLLGGGFRKGSWNLIEVSHNIGENYFAILQPFLVNHLNLNRGMVCILPEGLSLKTLLKFLEGFMDKEEIRKRIVSLTFQEEKIAGVEEVLLSEKIDETFSKLKIHQEKLERDCGTPVLTFIGIDKLIHLYETN